MNTSEYAGKLYRAISTFNEAINQNGDSDFIYIDDVIIGKTFIEYLVTHIETGNSVTVRYSLDGEIYTMRFNDGYRFYSPVASRIVEFASIALR